MRTISSQATMAGTGKGWKATDRKASQQRGGENGLPRSFGLTLEAVRYKRDLNQLEMMAALAEISKDISPWPFSDLAKNLGGRLGFWESAKTNPPFGALHRYGVLSDTLAGVLLITSHFYARLRDASNPTEDAQQHLDEITEIVRKLRGLCAFAEKQVLAAQKALPARESDRAPDLSQSVGPGDVRKKHLEFINQMLDAYRTS